MDQSATSQQATDETPFFFQRGDARLFGMLHSPVQSPRSSLGFVFSHPFAEEKLWAHRVFVHFARALAARGHAVLRFDFMGAGDSSGMTPDSSLETHEADLAAAVRELQVRQSALSRIGLMGLRLGAAIAAKVAERAATDDSLAVVRDAPLLLWDPTCDGQAYFEELLRSNLSTQLAVYGQVKETREMLQEKLRGGGTVNVDGYEIGRELFVSCAVAHLLGQEPMTHQGPALVLQISANDKVKEREDLKSLAARYRQGEFARAFEQPFWREIKPFYGRANHLQQVSLDWLEKHRG